MAIGYYPRRLNLPDQAANRESDRGQTASQLPLGRIYPHWCNNIPKQGDLLLKL